MEYIKNHNQFIIRLDKSDSVLDSLRGLVNKESVSAGHISGIGAIEEFVLGYYDRENKEYIQDTFEHPHELTSATGFVTQDESARIHMHATVAGPEHKAFGGHLHEGKIAAAGEFHLQVSETTVSRQNNEELGLRIMDFSS